MSNLYTGRTEHDLWAICVADYRFYRSSILNFRPGDLDGLGISPNYDSFDNDPVAPWQSKVCGIPCLTVEDSTNYFTFPDGLEDYVGVDGPTAVPYAFSMEVLSWPQARGSQAYMAYLGESTEASPYIGIGDDGLVRINLGAASVSDADEAWRQDAPLHFVFTRTAAAASASAAYCNGVQVLWNGALTVAAGAEGFTDALGQIFNHTDDSQDDYPCFGHHLFLRFYSDVLTAAEVRYLYKRAQRLVPHDLFHIPIIEPK